MTKNTIIKRDLIIAEQKLDAFVIRAKRRIELLRECWGIPIESGFKNDKELSAWQKKHFVQTHLNNHWHPGIPQHKLLKEQFLKRDNEKLGKFHINYWMKTEIYELMSKFDMALYYFKPIVSHILTGSFNLVELSEKRPFIDLQQKYVNGLIPPKEITIKIYPETTIKELQTIWPEIEKLKREIFGKSPNERKKLAKNYKRDKRIYELNKTGIEHKVIATIIKREYGTHLYRTEIPPILLRFKKKYGLNCDSEYELKEIDV